MTTKETSSRSEPPLSGRVLSALADIWPSPVRHQDERIGGVPGDDEYGRAYARRQFMRRVCWGLGIDLTLPPLWGKDILDIGCGHGGMSCYLATAGARRVLGIDLN